MSGFFGQDGIFNKIGSGIADMMILGLLWTLASLPLVTMGAATTAVYYVNTKKASGKDAYLWRDFWQAFRRDFLLSTAVFLTLGAILTLLVFNILNMGLVEVFGNFVLVLHFFILAELAFVALYAFAIISRFQMGYVQIFKSAFLMANRHIFTTLSNLVLLAAIILLSWGVMPILGVFAMGIYSYYSSFLIVRIFKKYRPDLDPDEEPGELAPLRIDDNVLNLDKLNEIQSNKDTD